MKTKIIWLTSYPKSGNTWLRFLISNYFFNPKRKFMLNIIKSIKNFPTEEELGKFIKKSEIIKNPYIMANYWLLAQENLKIKSHAKNKAKKLKTNLVFLKTHNALVSINNNSFTNEHHSLAAIHIVRDPRDVVISYSNFAELSYDESIEEILTKDLIYKRNKDLFRITGSWKFHYLSWKNGVPAMPKILVKYEDLLNNTEYEFYKIILFLSNLLNFKIDEKQIEFSVKHSTFDILSKYEKKYGFDEAKK